jgi:hypothetical protein
MSQRPRALEVAAAVLDVELDELDSIVEVGSIEELDSIEELELELELELEDEEAVLETEDDELDSVEKLELTTADDVDAFDLEYALDAVEVAFTDRTVELPLQPPFPCPHLSLLTGSSS